MNNITFDTITGIKPLIDQVVKTIVNLKEADFGKFTAERLPSDYFVSSWKAKNNFCDVWGNMDSTHQALFLRFCGYTDDAQMYLAIAWVNRFFSWAFNWDAERYSFNAFDRRTINGNNAAKLVTGKSNPQGIRDIEILRAYHRLNDDWKRYFLMAAFNAKKKEVAA